MNRMCWKPIVGASGQKILHLEILGQWHPYNSTVHAVPDHKIPGGSKGWATYQTLRQQGWELIKTPDVDQATSAS